MLKLFDRSWLAIVMLLSVAALPVRVQASTPSIVISEIAWAGSSISSSDEWIELANISNETIDLSGWNLTGAGGGEVGLVLPELSTIDPQSTYLISNYELSHENTALAVTPNFVTASLSLPNSGFNLHLYDNRGSLVDVAGGAGPPFAGRSGGTANSDGRYASMVRVDGLADGSVEASWTDATSSHGLTTDDLGTPGEIWSTDNTTTSDGTEESQINEEVSTDMPKEEPTASVRVNEFVVDPNEGENEWIELMNSNNESIDLSGWSIEDATGKQTILESIIEAGGYLLIESPLGKLNNDGDSIILKDIEGNIVDQVEYGTDALPAPKDAAALARDKSGVFELTYQPTPGSENVIGTEKPEATQEQIITEDEITQEGLIEDEITQEEITQDNIDEVVEDKPIVDVRVNEFVVDPTENGLEWIELYNAGDELTLNGWTIEDESGKATDLSQFSIENDSYLVIESPAGKLNNDEDSIILKDENGTIIDTVVYGNENLVAPQDGDALARNGETFSITQIPTPGKPNLIFVALEQADIMEEEPIALNKETEESQADESKEDNIVELPKTLRLISLYPNTIGSDAEQEYIVIENFGDEDISLTDWMLEDGSTNTYTLKGGTIKAGATVTLPRAQTKITLNNTGDTIELIAPDGEVADKVTYGIAAKGVTYDFIDGAWSWPITAVVADTQTSSVTSSSISNASNSQNTSTAVSAHSAQRVTIAEAIDTADGNDVVIMGAVTAAPGTFGSQVIYIQDKSGGIQVYLYSAFFPEVSTGDVVRVTGELSTSHSERRVKLANATGVVPASTPILLDSQEVSLEQINDELVGSLIQTTGRVQSKTSTKLILEDAGNTLTVYLKSSPAIDPNQFDRGDELRIKGVLTSYDGELRLRPRSIDDITVEQKMTMAAAANEPTASASSRGGVILLISIVIALALLALWRYVPRRRLTPTQA